MRRSLLAVNVLTAVAGISSARLLHSLPEDTYAFPKYRVAFLNNQPVLKEAAERWLKEGLRGGELEFLDQPWQDQSWGSTSQMKEIGSGDSQPAATSIPETSMAPLSTNYTLERMKMGPRDSYICLIPHRSDNPSSRRDDGTEADVTPARSWSLLQPLAGSCLYQRQGWWTYSYCHHDEIRQFKELVPSQPRFPGTYKPEEDPDYEAFTLGRAPRSREPGVDLSVPIHNVANAHIEVVQGAGSRYLVQRWSDGTICDMTGKSREVEVQFHCSLEMTDHILFVKETKICSYVMVIHTPRLCGEPGFKSRRDSGEDAQIRCREIVDHKPDSQLHLPIGDHPVKVPIRKTVLPAPKPVPKADSPPEEAEEKKEKMFNELLRKTLEALVAGTDGSDGSFKEALDDDLVVEIVDGAGDEVESDRLVNALRAAGYDVRAEVVTLGTHSKNDEDDKEDDDKEDEADSKHQAGDNPHRDEL